MQTIAYPDHRDLTRAGARPSGSFDWHRPPTSTPVSRQQHVLISLRLRLRERRIAKELAALVDSPNHQPVRWRRVYTAAQPTASPPEIDTWFRIDGAVGDLEGLHQASTVAPAVKSTHWVIADDVTRVLVGWDLTQLCAGATPRARRGLLRRFFRDRRGSGALALRTCRNVLSQAPIKLLITAGRVPTRRDDSTRVDANSIGRQHGSQRGDTDDRS
ncbi:hypothetical protein [Mycobacterium attenuatum]|uniref:hypothetical protein n=1 Tax=Mycobacterium attenuatum TaxID=2341086 RepID=UPI000F1E8D76|nr:hypothetical protein [Mycobacterium attenuatum]VBA62310.1 hypothetical protein LAUMK41_05701 [Mycobacterium attenuatum]